MVSQNDFGRPTPGSRLLSMCLFGISKQLVEARERGVDMDRDRSCRCGQNRISRICTGQGSACQDIASRSSSASRILLYKAFLLFFLTNPLTTLEELALRETMHREFLPIDQLTPWARANNIELIGVKISTGHRGSGVVSTVQESESDALLVSVPQDLVLSLENVWVYAKSDRHLLQVLEALGAYSRVAHPHLTSKKLSVGTVRTNTV